MTNASTYPSAAPIYIGAIPIALCLTMHTAMTAALDGIRREVSEARRVRARFAALTRPDLDARVAFREEELYHAIAVIDAIEKAVESGALPLGIGTWEIAQGWPMRRLRRADFRGALPAVTFKKDVCVLEGVGDRDEFEAEWQTAIRRDGDGLYEPCHIDDADATMMTDELPRLEAYNAALAAKGGDA
jgi:hypothetical protein